ncbi:Phosphorylated CTD-interacting factor 1 [Liparis tanakae]|uniref:Phosphorylated CTD-interacting factor 1 n=1 Tax=Liparis tanakae TaxID=230148 RepID=A0A4Z2EPE4_9TELE|nr:Phosphorylated CTD-interacting factor 1 [Liparis tanakae]
MVTMVAHFEVSPDSDPDRLDRRSRFHSGSSTSPVSRQALLEKSSEPLSFIVFVPEWRDPVTPALTRMEASRFLRHQLNIPAFEHEYRSGSQHICKRDEMYYRAVHGTAVLFLQNDAGFAKWAPTAERLAELMAAYRPSTARPPSLSSPGPAPIVPHQHL